MLCVPLWAKILYLQTVSKVLVKQKLYLPPSDRKVYFQVGNYVAISLQWEMYTVCVLVGKRNWNQLVLLSRAEASSAKAKWTHLGAVGLWAAFLHSHEKKTIRGGGQKKRRKQKGKGRASAPYKLRGMFSRVTVKRDFLFPHHQSLPINALFEAVSVLQLNFNFPLIKCS